MSDSLPEHRWMVGDQEIVADQVGIRRVGHGYVVGGTLCNEEIMRLAEENKRLRADLEGRERERAAQKIWLARVRPHISDGSWAPMPDTDPFRCCACPWRGVHGDLSEGGDCPACGKGVEPL